MKKHIKLEVTPISPEFTHVSVRVLEQTHRNDDFGNYGHRFTHKGFHIQSTVFPAAEGDVVALRGFDATKDNDSITISVETYQKLKATVEAYNLEFSKEVRHIKFQATPVPDAFTHVDVQILEQTHRGLEFCDCGDGWKYLDRTGYALMSDGCPQAYIGRACLRGRISGKDNLVIRFPVAEYNKFKDAVEAYNREYADGACATVPEGFGAGCQSETVG